MERGEADAGQDGEDAVEAGEFVDDEGKGDELGAGAEGHEVEEALGEEALVWCFGAGVGGGRITRGRGRREREVYAMMAFGGLETSAEATRYLRKRRLRLSLGIKGCGRWSRTTRTKQVSGEGAWCSFGSAKK